MLGWCLGGVGVVVGGYFVRLEACFPPPGAVLPEHGQPFAVEIEVHQGEVRAQPVVVLGDAPVAHLVEAEDALQDTEDVFYFRSDF